LSSNSDVKQIADDTTTDEDERDRLSHELEKKRRRKELDKKFDDYSDLDKNIRELMRDTTSAFSKNPRDLKRFMNVFRFEYFLLLARQNRGLNVPSDSQLGRWITLTLKWPDLARWIQGRYNFSEYTKKPAAGNMRYIHKRLKDIEDITEECKKQTNGDSSKTWQQKMESLLGLKAEKNSWIADESLRNFFMDELDKYKPEERLSASVGNGFY
jgi:hypothetical protein